MHSSANVKLALYKKKHCTNIIYYQNDVNLVASTENTAIHQLTGKTWELGMNSPQQASTLRRKHAVDF